MFDQVKIDTLDTRSVCSDAAERGGSPLEMFYGSTDQI